MSVSVRLERRRPVDEMLPREIVRRVSIIRARRRRCPIRQYFIRAPGVRRNTYKRGRTRTKRTVTRIYRRLLEIVTLENEIYVQELRALFFGFPSRTVLNERSTRLRNFGEKFGALMYPIYDYLGKRDVKLRAYQVGFRIHDVRFRRTYFPNEIVLNNLRYVIRLPLKVFFSYLKNYR